MKKTKIAILGAGAMGSLVGAFLIRGGADVIPVDPYEAHMDTIRTTGLTMHINEETICQQIPTCLSRRSGRACRCCYLSCKESFYRKSTFRSKSAFQALHFDSYITKWTWKC